MDDASFLPSFVAVAICHAFVLPSTVLFSLPFAKLEQPCLSRREGAIPYTIRKKKKKKEKKKKKRQKEEKEEDKKNLPNFCLKTTPPLSRRGGGGIPYRDSVVHPAPPRSCYFKLVTLV